MNELQIFNNPEFGELRTFIEPDGTKLICGSDVAKALGYSNAREAVRKFCCGGVKRAIGVETGKKANGKASIQMVEMSFIPEGDVYRLMYKAAEQSNNPDIKERAERFGGWIFDDVLPTINKTGSYITARADPQELRQRANELESVASLNDMAKIMIPILQEAGMTPVHQALTLKQIYRRAGIEIPVDGIKAERELYDLSTIASKVGILSLAGKPHQLAVAAIVKKLNISESQRELVSFERNGHMGTAYQYTPDVAMMVSKWVQDRGFPKEISGENKTYKVQYNV